MSKPYISVIIPAYNEEKLITYCLKNLKNQNFNHPYEIIVVNGPSTDKTNTIAKNYAHTVVQQTGIGIGQARQQGCQLAKGKILAITDADVFVPPNWLSKIYNYFLKHPRVIAITGPYEFVHSGNLNKASKIVRPIIKELHQFISDTVPLSGTNSAFKKSAYFKAGGFDPEITGLEDVELGIRLSKIGQVVYLSSLVVKTTDRRFRQPGKHILTTLLPTYIKRIVLKKKDKRVIWKPLK